MLRSTQRTATARSCTLQPHACAPVADKHHAPAGSGGRPGTVCRGWRAPCPRAACPAGRGSRHCCCWSAAAGPRAASGTRYTAAGGPAHRHKGGSPRQQSNLERVDIKTPPRASLGAPRALTGLSRAPRASPLRSAAGRRGSAQFNDGGGCGARSSRAGSPPAGPDMARMRCDCAAKGGSRRGPRAIILCGFHASESAWSTPAMSPRCARLSRHAPPGTTRALWVLLLTLP